MTYLETLKSKALELSKHPKLQKYLNDPKLISAAEKTVAFGNQAFIAALSLARHARLIAQSP